MDNLIDPREMRKRLHQVAFGHARIDGRNPTGWITRSPVSSLAHTVMRMGEMHGWSGEDLMAVLAYHALLECERLMDRALQEAAMNPRPPMIFPVDAAAEHADTSTTPGETDERTPATAAHDKP